MRIFNCPNCASQVYFENTSCGVCGAVLAFVPSQATMGAFTVDNTSGAWSRLGVSAGAIAPNCRPCANRVQHNVCNWMVEDDHATPYCLSCRLTSTIPSLGEAENWRRWAVIETAKRRLIYTFITHRLPFHGKQDKDDLHGLEFRWLATVGNTKVTTGHENGVVILNISEADDAVREARRVTFGEPLRTVLGHLRHEVSHHLHQRWVDCTPFEDEFRQLFGDERVDYSKSLEHYYANGPLPAWPDNFVSAYASSHPWEDWAETCAHYLLMIDAVETAAGWQLQVTDGTDGASSIGPQAADADSDVLVMQNWMPLARFLNAMSRSLGLRDSYPFAISQNVLRKLAFVQRVLRQAANSPANDRTTVTPANRLAA